ncbi:hypothetical protein [Saccharothrix sp. ST-888]|uniref:hypothetical protein n=1 Tax=Saccharothrix sp. ST-888 TaxID=1427391 RepID=UPI0005EC2469|nr:hypothetical protein [Saccharothrix sp. ST-888]KJK59262.1 hypothetical protein UK12_05400 [Saccharothrix sp. ST-888]
MTTGRRPRLLALQGSDGTVGWALSAANGRQLATGALSYRGDTELRAAIRELLMERAALRYLQHQDRRRLWVWAAYLPLRSTRPSAQDTVPVARSARGYLRRDQCRQGMDTFRASLHQLDRLLRQPGSELAVDGGWTTGPTVRYVMGQ